MQAGSSRTRFAGLPPGGLSALQGLPLYDDGVTRRGRLTAVVGLLVAATLFATTLLASPGASDVVFGASAFSLPSDLTTYFTIRYGQVDRLTSTLEETPHGPCGRLTIEGSLRPKNPPEGPTPENRARGIARAFLQQEAALLGIADLAAIKEREVRILPKEQVNVTYFLEVGGLELWGTHFAFRIDLASGGTIVRFSTDLFPVSPELESKLKSPTIPADAARVIVVRDLAADPPTPGIPSEPVVTVSRRFAFAREPWVGWAATAARGGWPAWSYTVDAFSGAVLSKNCTAIGIRASAPGHSPCGPYRMPIPAFDFTGGPTRCPSGGGSGTGGPTRAAGTPAPAVVRPASAVPVPAPVPAPIPEYTIEAIRYATVPRFPLAALMIGAPEDETIDIAMVVWLVRGSGRSILFDTGFHRERWMKEFTITDYLRPDEAVAQAGVAPGEVTDVVVSHAHWDHMGGIDLFPAARVWIQEQEFGYYTGDAWQPGGRNGGVDPDDVAVLRRLKTEGRLRFVDGDDVEILPGIRAYTGARHTYASQYLRVDGPRPVVLASDNCYLERNLSERVPSAVFEDKDRAANLAAQERMIALAGAMERVIPGHDLRQFERFPTRGRVARIR